MLNNISEQIKIKDLNQISLGQNNYRYKDVDFLLNLSENSKHLIIFFHGAIWEDYRSQTGLIPLPVYRGYNYHTKLEYVDTLCISDLLLERYNREKLKLAWFLSTPENDSFSLYKEIISDLLQRKTYDKIIFTGASGGGYPAILFSSFFNALCLVQNCQVYLNEYPYFKEFLSIIGYNDKDIDKDINGFIQNHGPPKKIYYFQNILDETHYKNHALPFCDFMDRQSPGIVSRQFFLGSQNNGRTVHHINTPPNESLSSLLNKVILDKLKS